MPKKDSFVSDDAYYATLYHELVHSTGAKHRLDRDLKAYIADKHAYSFEELIAEMGASYLCGVTQISASTIDDSVAYIKSWHKALSENPTWLIKAASAAQKAADYIINNK